MDEKDTINEKEVVALLRGNWEQQKKALKILFLNRSLTKEALKRIRMKGGSYQDAQDAYQDSLFILLRAVKKNGFQDIGKLSAYFTRICYNRWREIVKQSFRKKVMLVDDNSSLDNINQETPHGILEKNDKQTLIKQLLQRLPKPCYELLWNKALGFTLKEIATKNGISNYEVAKKKARGCRLKLKALLEENQALKDLFKSLIYE